MPRPAESCDTVTRLAVWGSLAESRRPQVPWSQAWITAHRDSIHKYLLTQHTRYKYSFMALTNLSIPFGSLELDVCRTSTGMEERDSEGFDFVASLLSVRHGAWTLTRPHFFFFFFFHAGTAPFENWDRWKLASVRIRALIGASVG